jgi:hypothetical protein
MPGISRFCVMATLQAARAYLLGLKQDEAFSWGLNRAIFYAAAKRGFKGGSKATSEYRAVKGREEKERPDVFRLGDDMAFKEVKDGKLIFTIGGKLQTREDFDRQISLRFKGRFQDAWDEALALLKQYDRELLLSQSAFYSEVYKPNRDSLVERWSQLVEAPAPAKKGQR